MELIYCVKCKHKGSSGDKNIIKTKNGMKRLFAKCCICNSKKSHSVRNFFLNNFDQRLKIIVI